MKRILVGLLVLISTNIATQEQMSADPTAVKSIDGIVKEVLRLISSDGEKTRNWEAFRYLFIPTARFSVLNQSDSIPHCFEGVSLEEFIQLLDDPYYEQGFLEYEIGKVVLEYNGIANVFQSFYAIDSEKQGERGITSYQLAYFNDRWWIVNILWTTDSNGVAIPEKYLGN